MSQNTDILRDELSCAVDDLKNSVHAFKVWCRSANWDQTIVNITEEFTEIFPNVMAKVSFEKDNGSKIITIKAKAGSKVNPHKMIPNRFIYVVHGNQRDETGVIVLNEDEGMVIKPLEEVSMHFTVDTKLIMEIESMNDEAA